MKAVKDHPLDKVLDTISNKMNLLLDTISGHTTPSTLDDILGAVGRLGMTYDAVLDSKNDSIGIEVAEPNRLLSELSFNRIFRDIKSKLQKNPLYTAKDAYLDLKDIPYLEEN